MVNLIKNYIQFNNQNDQSERQSQKRLRLPKDTCWCWMVHSTKAKPSRRSILSRAHRMVNRKHFKWPSIEMKDWKFLLHATMALWGSLNGPIGQLRFFFFLSFFASLARAVRLWCTRCEFIQILWSRTELAVANQKVDRDETHLS